jgi:tetratricopeptide (TPR) repeat protein
MRRLASFSFFAFLFIAGCASLEEDRWRMVNEDGVRSFAKGNYRDALESFDYALTLHANDSVLIYNIAQCYDRLGNAKNAEQYYSMCLQRDSKHADARLALITLRYRTGKTTDANQMIRDWLKQDPDSADPYVADAWRLRQERNLPLAQGRLQEALGKDLNNRRALTELAILNELQGMPDRAYVMYESILAQEPNQLEISERLEILKVKGVKRPAPN